MLRRPSLPVLLSVAMLWASPGWAQSLPGRGVATVDGSGENAWAGNIRASDEQLLSLLKEGFERSPTFRSLVERLRISDLILYVRPDVTARNSLQTRLTFLATTGGYRYVVIRVAGGQTKDRQMAMLGHEMQNAIAIAEARDVVDSQSLRRAFERVGQISASSLGDDFVFTNPRAEETRRAILRELAL